ncbi:ABC transporter substrate-binding protein [Lyngbya confervoides]|uniref:ABC transporter substrate-binding protein n=1 Tax=Lyngbya confervoides BDU141951 TaxID=1574623 RepID=A0ABD4TAI3_9CYAN|nr:ABC transporter substrate-binding protein [Lyngbya confervoides]MCM1985363.1 ABC transporter substrate-binding protein [Lyngbya confervoides BDU141951]
MKRRRFFSLAASIFLTVVLVASCSQAPNAPESDLGPAIKIGYSNWAGWWPWAVAEEEKLFEKNGVNVELKWFDGYVESMEAFATGQLDGNSQTLNDTVSFAAGAPNGEVVVLVNDNSEGNDKIIVSQDIQTIQDLKGKKVAVEEGVVDDFLLSLALEQAGMKRSDVEIVPLETGKAAAAFAAGQVDATGVFPPFWLTALEREGSKELVSSKEFPGAIPDLLVVSQTLIDQQPEKVQALVNTWYDTLEFIEQNPEKSDEIMAKRAGVSTEDFQKFKDGTRIFTIEENLEAFSPGDNMKHMPFAARKMADFMVSVGLMKQEDIPDFEKLFDDRFVKAYAAENASAS